MLESPGVKGSYAPCIHAQDRNISESAAKFPSTDIDIIQESEVQIVSPLGEGAFGEVTLANCKTYGRVAIKWLKVGVLLWEVCGGLLTPLYINFLICCRCITVFNYRLLMGCYWIAA
jgi:hypothetical protein